LTDSTTGQASPWSDRPTVDHQCWGPTRTAPFSAGLRPQLRRPGIRPPREATPTWRLNTRGALAVPAGLWYHARPALPLGRASRIAPSRSVERVANCIPNLRTGRRRVPPSPARTRGSLRRIGFQPVALACRPCPCPVAGTKPRATGWKPILRGTAKRHMKRKRTLITSLTHAALLVGLPARPAYRPRARPTRRALRTKHRAVPSSERLLCSTTRHPSPREPFPRPHLQNLDEDRAAMSITMPD